MVRDERPRVVIVGAGFGGLEAARRFRGQPVHVTLVDQVNHHLFQPLLYQVATAGLNPADIAAPIRALVRRQKNVEVLLAQATRVDLRAQVVLLDDGRACAYERLILACGATHSYFGHDDWARRAPGLKSITDAAEIRHRILWAFEAAEQEDDPAAQAALQTFAVVGGGPTGVELAGAVVELARHTLQRDFRRIDPRRSRVVLLEAGPALLPAFAPALREEARRKLERLGVEVRVGAAVSDIDDEGLVAAGERLSARTVLWAAGVAASPLGRSLGVPVDRAGRVKVEPDLSLPGHPEVFVIGDMALALQEDGRPVPGVAPAAMQEGRHAARNVLRSLQDAPSLPFKYRDKGSLATIGRNAAVGQLGRLELRGRTAWFAWLFVHLLYLVGFRNRVAVVLQWAWAFLTFQRSARLITVPVEQLRRGRLRPAPELVPVPAGAAEPGGAAPEPVPGPAPVDLAAPAREAAPRT